MKSSIAASLAAQLDAIAEDGAEPDRKRVVEVLKAALIAGREEVRKRFEAGASGAETVHALSFLVDQLIRLLHDFVGTHVYPIANPTAGERMALIAVGGYGRGELAPFSDIDLLFLTAYKRTPHTEQVVEYLLYTLWDLGLKVGQSTRSVEETIRHAAGDLTIRTAVLEARYIWGDQELFAELKRRFDSDIARKSATQFIEAKLAERNQRHEKLGDSRYLVEPNVKESKGGLRDLHTLFWIAKYVYRVDDIDKLVDLNVLSAKEAQRFARAQNFLWTVRCHLHFIAGRAEDRLTFDRQSEVGTRMGYRAHTGARGVERFMKHYFLIAKDVGDLTRIFCAVLEVGASPSAEILAEALGLRQEIGRGLHRRCRPLGCRERGSIRQGPGRAAAALPCRAEGRARHPSACAAAHDAVAEAHRCRAAEQCGSEPALRRDPDREQRQSRDRAALDERIRACSAASFPISAVSSRRCNTTCITPIRSTSIRCSRSVSCRMSSAACSRKSCRCATTIFPTIDSRRAIYLAVLLHDIAKGRGGDHSVLGAQVAERLGPRLGFSAEETETIAWLIRWHLSMSNTAFKFDIDDPKTITDFVARVQSPERLKLLLLLTVADIRAVGPKIWNGWKAALLRELYHRAFEQMSGGIDATAREERVRQAQESVKNLLPDFTAAEIDSFNAKGYPFYWLSFDAETQARHARLVREAERSGAPLTVDTRVDTERAVTEITLYTADHAGLFSRIAGALALAGANIVDAKIHTMSNGMALDTFWVQDRDGGAVDQPQKLAKLSVMFENVLVGKLKPHIDLAAPASMPSRTRVFTVPPRVLIDNKASSTHTVIEVNGRDRTGLLYEVTRALTQLNLQISSAKISTYGEKVVDVFYVKDLFGHKVDHEKRLADIRERLAGALADPDAAKAAEKSDTVAAE